MPQPSEAALEEQLAAPTPALVRAMGGLDGDIVVLGAGGKMGPSLARLAVRASEAAGAKRHVFAVSRFRDEALRARLDDWGVRTIACDLLDADAVANLPDAPHVVYMVGQKFGTTGDGATTWALNTVAPAVAAERYRRSRIVAFSTGNVYPLWTADSQGPTEDDLVGPVGEYAWSALARERVLTWHSTKHGTPMVILRLNYAVEPRYGVLRDIADRVHAGLPVDLTMGAVNVIWQRDANAVALMALACAASPPLVLNVTGPRHSVRWIAEEFGRRFVKPVVFQGAEASTALLSDASRAWELFGQPEAGIDEMIDRVAEWVTGGGRSLGKPTHFEEREGKF